jgi:hypothetical protein
VSATVPTRAAAVYGSRLALASARLAATTQRIGIARALK